MNYIRGNIFDTDIRTIAHGCNNSGGFGSGIAGQIAFWYPKAKQDYLSNYKIVGLGGIISSVQTNGKRIINCITQQKYGNVPGKVYVDYNAIKTVFQRIDDMCLREIEKGGIFEQDRRLAIPKIGAGLGGGDWGVISEIIEKECKNVEVYVYEY